MSFINGAQILLDAFPVKDMSAFRLYSVFCDVIAKSANGCFTGFVLEECSGIILTFQNEVRMASHLPHTCQSDALFNHSVYKCVSDPLTS